MNLAEQIATRILAGMGMTPKQVYDSYTGFINDARAIKFGVLGARQGFSEAVSHFNARLDVLETHQRAIMVALDISPVETNPALLLNGGSQHDGSNPTGS
jgi:hypothetical protein